MTGRKYGRVVRGQRSSARSCSSRTIQADDRCTLATNSPRLVNPLWVVNSWAGSTRCGCAARSAPRGPPAIGTRRRGTFNDPTNHQSAFTLVRGWVVNDRPGTSDMFTRSMGRRVRARSAMADHSPRVTVSSDNIPRI